MRPVTPRAQTRTIPSIVTSCCAADAPDPDHDKLDLSLTLFRGRNDMINQLPPESIAQGLNHRCVCIDLVLIVHDLCGERLDLCRVAYIDGIGFITRA